MFKRKVGNKTLIETFVFDLSAVKHAVEDSASMIDNCSDEVSLTNLLVSCFKIRITCRTRYWPVWCTASHSPRGNSLVHFLAGSAHLPHFWVDPGPGLLPQPSPCFPRCQPSRVFLPLGARSLSGPPLLPSWKHLKTINKLSRLIFLGRKAKTGKWCM